MKGLSLIVKTISRLVVPFIVIFGFYIVLYGHLTPGGGFAGGVILACSVVLLVLAFGKETALRIVSEKSAAVWDCLGAFAFLFVALLGFRMGNFFYNFLAEKGDFKLFSAGIIPICNIAIGIKVGACLFGVFLALSVFRIYGRWREVE